MYKRIPVLFLFAIVLNGIGQTREHTRTNENIRSPLLINTAGRATTSLNGKWHYIVDPYETGYYNFHSVPYEQGNPGSPAAFYNNYHTTDKSALIEYDFDRSPVMNIPGDWNTQEQKLFYYEGTVWFKRSFDYVLKQDRRLFIYFGGVNYKTDVYLNGTKLGTHIGGFTPFNFEITGLVKPTGNYLVVKVDNIRRKEGVPTENTDWWNYGGITRDVQLIEEPSVFIRDYFIQLQKKNNKLIKGYVQLDGAHTSETVHIRIPELKIDQSLVCNTGGYGQFEIPAAGIQYWSPEVPRLYTLYIKTASQTLKDEIGFRTISTEGKEILLNGNPIFLKGISIHEDYQGRRAFSEKDALSMLALAKSLGCNYVRLAHYPHNENIIRQADELGLMVWEEIPVYWTIDFGNSETYINARNQLSEMIGRDKNRACTIIWSMANETPISELRNRFIGELAAQARSLDSTRLISAALLTRSENGLNIVDDIIGEKMDIVAFNQYRGWYGGDLATAPDAKWICPYNKPIVVSEFGGDALQGKHGTKNERWTEEYQEYLYRQNLRMLDKIAGMRGMSPWILMDFRSPRRLLPGIQDGFNRKGLVSDKGKKKKAFYILQAYYRNK